MKKMLALLFSSLMFLFVSKAYSSPSLIFIDDIEIYGNGAESVWFKRYAKTLPRATSLFGEYSPGVEIDYSGLANDVYTIKVWLLERSNWYCGVPQGTVLCEGTFSINNIDGTHSSGKLIIPDIFQINDYPTFRWLVRMYRGGSQVVMQQIDAGATYNRSPILSPIDNIVIEVGSKFSTVLKATDKDKNILTYNSSTLPHNATLDKNTGLLTWEPTTDDEGESHDVRFTVQDNGEGNLEDSAYISMTATCTLNGDVNKDGQVTPMDALLCFKQSLGIDPPFTGCQLKVCDANKDGLCTPADALCIFKKALGMPSCLDLR